MIPKDLESRSAEEILRWAYAEHERVALVASFQAESSVLIDLACRVVESPEVITLDTGRLPQETHDLMDAMRERYPIRLRIVQPDPVEVEAMTGQHGTNLFRKAVELRLLCCDVRKSRPLERALKDYDAWITGPRREQGPTRSATPVAAPDRLHGGLLKVAPLVNWSKEQVWDYIREHDLPHHALYAQGYTSIGCAPCTRPTQAGEDERAGRWWWEENGVKECGLHWEGGRAVRTEQKREVAG